MVRNIPLQHLSSVRMGSELLYCSLALCAFLVQVYTLQQRHATQYIFNFLQHFLFFPYYVTVNALLKEAGINNKWP
jgi:hypothetical protein